jgi:flavin reductase (DIM6/NTAB) family NADH-FMN oxidoreductase RutF
MNPLAFTKLSYGVYVVTSWADGGKPTGCTANSAMQVTAAPATIAVSINHSNFTNECIKNSGMFAVNILGENTKPLTIGTFGFRSGRDFDKFAETPEVKNFLPVVDGSIAHITCKVIDSMETSTHTVFLGEVTGAEVLSDDTPMTYAYYHNVIKGKSPKTAPTYIEEK